MRAHRGSSRDVDNALFPCLCSRRSPRERADNRLDRRQSAACVSWTAIAVTSAHDAPRRKRRECRSASANSSEGFNPSALAIELTVLSVGLLWPCSSSLRCCRRNPACPARSLCVRCLRARRSRRACPRPSEVSTSGRCCVLATDAGRLPLMQRSDRQPAALLLQPTARRRVSSLRRLRPQRSRAHASECLTFAAVGGHGVRLRGGTSRRAFGSGRSRSAERFPRSAR